ncbi:MAG: Fe-S cluster assembly protein SufD [Actinobacteria bacterium]|nr:Fe-S cluster assembly protein SufD [Actinomycetota bacterium]
MTAGSTASPLAAFAAREPAWLRLRRRDAWDVFQATPAPAQRDEEWHRTDTAWMRWDAVKASPNGRTPRALPAAVRATAIQPTAAVVTEDGSSAAVHLSDEAKAAGVLVMSLADATLQRPDLVEGRVSLASAPATLGKFEALNAALWAGGALVYVPRDVALAAPILVAVSGTQAAQIYPHTLVVLASGARANVVEWWTSPADGPLAVANGVVEVEIGAGASLTLTHVQAWGATVRSILTQRAILAREAKVVTTNVTLGGRFHKASVDAAIQGPGADVRMNAVYYLTDQQFVDHHTLQDHVATDATSDLLFAGALDGASRSVYQGTIIVQRHAQRSNAYQKNLNLMLGKGSRADSIPQLEIKADDVRCTHGATTSTVDPRHLFYLQTRGLSAQQARALMLDGYFEPVLERLPDASVRDVVRSQVQGKVARVRDVAAPAGTAPLPSAED